MSRKPGDSRFETTISLFRQEHGVRMTELARYLGVGRNTVARWNRDEAQLPQVARLALQSLAIRGNIRKLKIGGAGGLPQDSGLDWRSNPAAALRCHPSNDERHPPLFPEHLKR